MKKFVWLIAVFLVYEQAELDIVPCGELGANSQWVTVPTAPGSKEQVFAQNACVKKIVREISRTKFKNAKLAEKVKTLPEIAGMSYRIEEAK